MLSPIVLRRLALAGAATGVAALSGCSAITSSDPTGEQASPLAAVTVAQRFCLYHGTEQTEVPSGDEPCAPFDGYGGETGHIAPTGPSSGRLLVAAEVADGAPDPVFHLRRTPGTPLQRDDAATASLPTSDTGGPQASRDGYHWVGYRSAIVAYAVNEPDAGDVVEASVPVDALSATPTVAGLRVGDQVILDGFGADYGDRPVDCNENLSGSRDVSSITCPTSLSAVGPEAVTDAQVGAPDAAAAAAGTTATLRFVVAQSGTVAEASVLTVDAGTTIAGASASTDVSTLPWAITPPAPPADPDQHRARARTTDRRAAADEDGVTRTPVAVSVAVPEATATGTYAVSLRIRDAAGAERTATANLRVAGKPAPAPPATPAAPAAPAAPAPTAVLATVKATKVSATRRRVHAGRVTCKGSTRCIVSTVVRAGTKRVGFVRFVLQPGKSGAVTLRLSRPATALLAKRGGTITVSVDAGGPKTLVRVTKLAVQKG